jgi:transposase-like protein
MADNRDEKTHTLQCYYKSSLRYSLSYRDLEEIMLERGLYIDHTTIYWLQSSTMLLSQGFLVYAF